jgi:L-threonylcarbamoyladenylate synthase
MSKILSLEEAVGALASGEVIALPTDTVYGVGAAINKASVAKVFELKQRPHDVALPVLVCCVEQALELGISWNERAQLLSDAFWPGPLTIVVSAPSAFAETIGSTTKSVGLRMPKNEALLDVLKNGPLCVSSANNHGETPCETALQVLETFNGRAAFFGVLDGGTCSGEVSTVVDVTSSNWKILRSGAIGEETIKQVLFMY